MATKRERAIKKQQLNYLFIRKKDKIDQIEEMLSKFQIENKLDTKVLVMGISKFLLPRMIWPDILQTLGLTNEIIRERERSELRTELKKFFDELYNTINEKEKATDER